MSISLIDIQCPSCDSTCWINNGDETDLTAPDVEAIRCWKCLECFWTLEEYSTIHEPEVTPEDYAEKSFATAKEAL